MVVVVTVESVQKTLTNHGPPKIKRNALRNNETIGKTIKRRSVAIDAFTSKIMLIRFEHII
ncbi:hypothetical protein D3C83_316600 [compost metagenome]